LFGWREKNRGSAVVTLFESSAGLPDGLFSNQKIQIWVNLGRPWNLKSWNILWPFGMYYGHLVYLMDI
jgi:hypothetical protein